MEDNNILNEDGSVNWNKHNECSKSRTEEYLKNQAKRMEEMERRIANRLKNVKS